MAGNKKVSYDKQTHLKIARAVRSILEGTCSRVDVNENVKVYECKNIVRIDLKITEEA